MKSVLEQEASAKKNYVRKMYPSCMVDAYKNKKSKK